jgi:hypothetical protein
VTLRFCSPLAIVDGHPPSIVSSLLTTPYLLFLAAVLEDISADRFKSKNG